MSFGFLAALTRSANRIGRQRHAMCQQSHALVIRKPVDEDPQGFRLLRKALGPRRMPLGDLPLGNALVDAGGVPRKPSGLRRDLQTLAPPPKIAMPSLKPPEKKAGTAAALIVP